MITMNHIVAKRNDGEFNVLKNKDNISTNITIDHPFDSYYTTIT